jgi:hypothetical protein
MNGDGAALSVKLNSPQELAVDSAGYVYIGDQLNQRIRRLIISNLPNSGTISTVAGSDHERGQFCCVAVDSPPLNLFVIGYKADVIGWVRVDGTIAPFGKRTAPECNNPF